MATTAAALRVDTRDRLDSNLPFLFVPLPHQIELLFDGKLSGLPQLRLIYYIAKQTWGKLRKKNSPPPEWCSLSYSALEKLLDCDRRWIIRLVDDMLARGILQRRPADRSFQYRLWWENWQNVPDCKGIEPREKPEPEPPAEPEPASQIHVRGGGEARLPFEVEGKPVFCYNSGRATADFEVINDPTRLILKVSLGQWSGRNQTKGESASLNTVESANYKNFIGDSANPLILQGEKPRFEFLTKVFLERFGKPLDEPLRQRIATALADTPEHHYEFVCSERLKRGGRITSGLFVHLAAESREGWRMQQTKVQQTAATSAAAVFDPADALREIASCLADPDVPAHIRAAAVIAWSQASPDQRAAALAWRRDRSLPLPLEQESASNRPQTR